MCSGLCSGLMARCGYSGLVVASLSLQINHLCCNSIVQWQKRIRNEETGSSNPLSSTILSNHLALSQRYLQIVNGRLSASS
jgi:hypothetical protein